MEAARPPGGCLRVGRAQGRVRRGGHGARARRRAEVGLAPPPGSVVESGAWVELKHFNNKVF